MSTIEKALAKQKHNKENEQDLSKNSTVISEQELSTNVNPEKTNHVSPTLKINKDDLLKRGYLIKSDERKNIKDELRPIKRKLLDNAFGKASKMLNFSNLIMVTSARPNEGKTFVAINLALSIALEQDKTVLLIDADVLRPSICRELGFDERLGLTEYLSGEVNQISDVLNNTNIEKLKVISAGKSHHLSNELLASERMISLAKELATRYPDRVVIFDCPPLLGISETYVLADLVGQAVIVVEESKTYIEEVKKATQNLNEDLAIGLVINKAISSHQDMYGYYGYGSSEKG
ncbi:MAG: protein-tyrosine kinase [Alteromonadaceae bacterium]|jgi:protein-tyrosine kinase